MRLQKDLREFIGLVNSTKAKYVRDEPPYTAALKNAQSPGLAERAAERSLTDLAFVHRTATRSRMTQKLYTVSDGELVVPK